MPSAQPAETGFCIDGIDELRELNNQMKASWSSLTPEQSSSHSDEPLWNEVEGKKEDHHLGAGLGGRWF
ncbi:hypothetical protein [Polycladidibacter stylochi]|uniref:hypothetical protein n=1 Tax=Polycladidibacter stylochi TaxID=1807766 RepID=UPI0012E3485E|nr:hypothetical protein [Pseudovibrio stylochi]